MNRLFSAVYCPDVIWPLQNKPQGKTARLVEQATELRNCLEHPRVQMAVINQDSLFSQVRVVSCLIAFILVSS